MRHNHRCPKPECGVVWHHDRDSIPDTPEAYQIAHECPVCHTEQRAPDDSGLPPTYCWNGARQLPLDPTNPPPNEPLELRQARQQLRELLALLQGDTDAPDL